MTDDGRAEAFDSVGKYQLLERLGQGGMAEVFLAVAPGLAGFSKKLVLKRVLPGLETDPTQVEMFLDEARLAARLEHPNICQVFDLGSHDGSYFIVMEHVPGVTFYQVITSFRARGDLVPMDVGLRCVSQLLEALEYAHALKDEHGRPLNLVHRDVTPTNIMVTPLGSVKLLDFGIARAATRQHRTQVGLTKGKLGYMSPEQCCGSPIDNRSDLFAVGAILYLLATGRPPYQTKELTPEAYEAMVLARFPKPTDIRPDVPPDLEAVILKAMASEPQDRYRRAFDMLSDLERVAKRAGVSLGPNRLAEVVQQLTMTSSSAVAPKSETETRARPASKPRPSAPPPPPEETRALPAPPGTEVERKQFTKPSQHLGEQAATSPELPPVRSAKRGARGLAVGLVVLFLFAIGAVVTVFSSSPRDVDGVEGQPMEVEARLVDTVANRAPAEATVAAGEPTGTVAAAEAPVENPPPPVEPVEDGLAIEKPRPAPARRTVSSNPPRRVTGPTGILTVSSTPRAQVRYENRVLGDTPLEVALPEGTQRVELLYPGQPARRLLVNIVAGQRTPLTDTF